MTTATHYVLRPGYEGPCCLDCASAVGGARRELAPSDAGYGQPCWSCEEMQRDADADAVRAEETGSSRDW